MIVKINGKCVDKSYNLVDNFIETEQTIEELLKKSRFRFIDLDVKPKHVLHSSSIAGLIVAYVGISHYLAWGVVAFAGTAWMFGHRTKAIELLIGASLGYLIILHAPDYIDFLEALK